MSGSYTLLGLQPIRFAVPTQKYECARMQLNNRIIQKDMTDLCDHCKLSWPPVHYPITKLPSASADKEQNKT